MLVCTTQTVAGKEIEQTLGTVGGSVCYGLGLLTSICYGFATIFGGRCNTFEKKMAKAMGKAVSKLEKMAHDMGANAVVGLQVTHLGLYVQVTGTAVILK